MKRKDTTTLRYLLLILAAAILNCLLDGTMNLIVTVCLCLALIPTARRMDGRHRKRNKQHTAGGTSPIQDNND